MGDGVSSLGGYEIVEQMGAGTVGTVYRARQVAMDRLVALKILNAKYAGDPSFVKSFIAEARTAGRINHPNVCQVYDVGNQGGVYYFSMELVGGPTLQQILKERGRLPPDEALGIVRGVAAALGAAHGHGLVHRDVKPANIVLANSGQPKLVDLGVAKDVNVPGADLGSGLVGTPYYMPPEQGQGKAVDIRSDIYALGATFYHMLVGRPPFIGPHPTAVMIKHASEPLKSPSELDPAIPREISAIVEKMMAKKPEDRYADPQALIADLDRGAKAAPAKAAPQGKSTSQRRPSRKRSVARSGRGSNVAVPAAVGGGVLLVLIVLAVMLSGGRDPAVVRAERALARASTLLARGGPEATEEAVSIASGVRERLPSTSEGKALESRADRILKLAESAKVSLEIRALDDLVIAVVDGTRSAASAKASIREVHAAYEASSMTRESVGRIVERCGLAAEKIDAFAERKTDRTPKLGAATKAVLARAGKEIEDGRYAHAMRVIDEIIEQTRAHDRSALEAARTDVRKRAEKDFSALMREVQGKIDSGDLAQAQLALEGARPRFDFGAYPDRLDARIAELKEIVAAAREAEEEDARLDEPEPAPEVAVVEPGALTDDTAGPAPEDALPAETDLDAEAAADAAAQRAALDFFEEEGWLPEGGTWRLEDEVLKLEVPEGSSAKLIYDDDRVSDVTTQFDAKIVAGQGFRLQYRWTDVAPGAQNLGRFAQRAVDLGRGYALFVDATNVLLQVRGAPARGLRGWRNALNYETWIKKLIRGDRWNRFTFQAAGTRLVAVVNGRMQLARGDESFQSGRVRFEFLDGSEIEMRGLKIRAR